MASLFRRRLGQLPEGPRRWFYVAYDQLNDAIGPWAEMPSEELGFVLVESADKPSRRPYHQQKLALILGNQRHFALEQAARGVAVDYRFTSDGYADALEQAAGEHGTLEGIRPAEYELREELAPLVADGRLTFADHDGWLTTRADFEAAQSGPPWRMDAFYRHVRRRYGVLMEGDKPLGGRFSFDGDNRKAWRGDPPAPTPPTFEVDDITREVGDLIRERYADHPGHLDLAALPATREDARASWDWAKRECLPMFGPYQDAMSANSESLFHSRISALLHLHRLLPEQVLDDALAADLPLASQEGFVRQILGWREYVRHVHEATDGLRAVESDPLQRDADLPPAFWGQESGMRCLDEVVSSVWRTGYGHHITRLMVLSNLATLLDVEPRQLSDWFWVAYCDAFDWVVEPNVLGMGTYSVGDLMTTKPYVCGAAYIDRMSDFCGDCAFDPRKNCPIASLYWAFLDRHEPALRDNPRLRMPMASLRRRSASRREADGELFSRVSDALANGEVLAPDSDMPSKEKNS
jgi:deoxyribodipyrimidine photolyase-related protein